MLQKKKKFLHKRTDKIIILSLNTGKKKQKQLVEQREKQLSNQFIQVYNDRTSGADIALTRITRRTAPGGTVWTK